MRVLLITNLQAVHARRWAKSLTEKVDKLIVISCGAGKIRNSITFNFIINSAGRNKIKAVYQKVRFIIRTWIVIISIKPDIIHVHYLYPDITIFSYLFFKKLIISVWGSDITDNQNNYKQKILFRQLALNKAKFITATSNYLSKETQKYCSKSIIKIPFGIDLTLFRLPIYDNSFPSIIKIGYVKHLDFKYGPQILIDAIKKIKYPSEVYFVGQGIHEDELRKQTEKLKLSNVQFLGFIPNNILPKFLRKLHLFVMPTIYPESFGVAALEAAAMGVPVIASNVGGISEVVLEHETGILVSPNDSNLLAEAINNLLDNFELYLKIKSNCRRFVTENYNWQDNVDHIIHLYKRSM